MKLKLWMVDLAGGAIMAGAILAAYYFDGPANPKNAIKPVTTNTDSWLKCHDGQAPVNYQCPDGDRL
jgi:hypothetical protein